ncbi:2-succinyl-5-enolpyruvyl-6-hydroxy-3-cyclohexene-1-carboxylic-acid synthase [Thiolapillus sp.]
MDQGRINLDWCLALLDGLVGAGVTRIVLSPGSRNTPLTLAAVLHPQLQQQVIVDERSAAFFALGMAMQSRSPVALVCTSGTAVANWFPAVAEANRQQLPLILLSADRPWELQQCQANQTIDQVKLFGEHVRAFHQLPVSESAAPLRRLRALGRQLVKQSSMPDAGPVHVNVSLREPLAPVKLPESVPPVKPNTPSAPILTLPEEALQTLASSISGRQGIIVCGPGPVDAAVLKLGEALACPVLADPLSGLRLLAASPVIRHYDLFLRSSATRQRLKARWVLHFGGLPVSRALQDYLDTQADAQQWWVDESGRWMDRPQAAVDTLQVSDGVFCRQLLDRGAPAPASGWLNEWQALERQAEQRLQQQELPLEAQIMRHALCALPAQSLIFSGNSMAVRFLDAYSDKRQQEIRVHGNRGASGIDGNLSTLSGIASTFEGEGKVLGIVGDLAFFHDLNALELARRQDMIVLLLNNHGGGIFDFLPQRELPEYDACWRTPVDLEHRHVAAAFGVDHTRVRDKEAFAEAFAVALNKPGLQLIEVVIDSAESNGLHRAVIDQYLD